MRCGVRFWMLQCENFGMETHIKRKNTWRWSYGY